MECTVLGQEDYDPEKSAEMCREPVPMYHEAMLSTIQSGCKLDAKLRPLDLCRHDDHFLNLRIGIFHRKQIAPKIYGDDCFSLGLMLNDLVC